MSIDPASLATWLAEPLSTEVAKSIERLRTSEDVRHVAIMPDVHLSKEVCVGAVVATERLIYPSAVGGDIGCGMIALAFDAEAEAIDDERNAARALAALYETVPSNKHRQPREQPARLLPLPLSDGRLEKLASRDGRVQLGTLGRGNHFLEFQSDQDGRLWVMIHSGSRAIGQAIANHHLARADIAPPGLKFLDANSDAGKHYLADVEWARAYAAENRLAMLTAVIELLHRLFGISPDHGSQIHSDHNHVQRELHNGNLLWVHRKGTQSARADETGIIPGSMGSPSFHTLGRGHTAALTSSSHGAGRALSRTAARQAVTTKEFQRQVGPIWYDRRRVDKLLDEAPAAYKEIRRVMRAQRDLTRIVRELRPILSYKGD